MHTLKQSCRTPTCTTTAQGQEPTPRPSVSTHSKPSVLGLGPSCSLASLKRLSNSAAAAPSQAVDVLPVRVLQCSFGKLEISLAPRCPFLHPSIRAAREEEGCSLSSEANACARALRTLNTTCTDPRVRRPLQSAASICCRPLSSNVRCTCSTMLATTRVCPRCLQPRARVFV